MSPPFAKGPGALQPSLASSMMPRARYNHNKRSLPLPHSQENEKPHPSLTPKLPLVLRRDTTQGSTSASLTSSSGKTATANSVSTKDNGAGTQTTKITQDGAKPGSAAPPGVLSVQKGAAKAPGAPGAKPGAKVVDGKKAVEHKHKPKAAAGQPQLGAPQPPPPASGQGFFGGSNVPPGMNALCASMPGMC